MKKCAEALQCASQSRRGTALRSALVVAPGQAMQKPHKRMTNQGANLQQGWSCGSRYLPKEFSFYCFNCFQVLLFYCAWKLNSFFLLAVKTRRLLTEAASYKCSDSSLDPFENQSVQAFQNLYPNLPRNFICFLLIALDIKTPASHPKLPASLREELRPQPTSSSTGLSWMPKSVIQSWSTL